MSLDALAQLVPTFVLVFFRLAAMCFFAPLFGSARIPKRIKVMMALVLALGMMQGVKAPVLPPTMWEMALGIAGEMFFGFAMGMILSFTFIAAQWGGEIMSQQMGLSMGSVFDPQFGGEGTIVGDLYYMLALVVFLSFGGHRLMLLAVHDSFTALPLLSLGINVKLITLIVGLLQSTTMLATQLAAPMLVTMLIVDVALGCIGKTMPQINLMTAGTSLRSLLGLVVMALGLALTADVLSEQMHSSMHLVRVAWSHR